MQKTYNNALFGDTAVISHFQHQTKRWQHRIGKQSIVLGMQENPKESPMTPENPSAGILVAVRMIFFKQIVSASPL
jgi:hypothetical protein